MSKRHPMIQSASTSRTMEQVLQENAAVLHAIGTKTFQIHTLELEITGLENRVRALNQEAAEIRQKEEKKS